MATKSRLLKLSRISIYVFIIDGVEELGSDTLKSFFLWGDVGDRVISVTC